MRAFLNGRIDLTQAEAVRDLIDSHTLYQAKVAAQQLEGALSRRLQPLKQKLVELIACLKLASILPKTTSRCFPASKSSNTSPRSERRSKNWPRTFAYGKIVHEGLTLAIVGRPNVGKSSLFNRLVERERAIVTATPGTTRDLVTETVSLGGIPVKLVDTAGIRRALDEAESIGIQKSMEALADADLVLVVLDASQAGNEEDEHCSPKSRSARFCGAEQSGFAGIAGRGSHFQSAPASPPVPHLRPHRRRHPRTARSHSPPRHRRRGTQHRIWLPHQRPPSVPGARFDSSPRRRQDRRAQPHSARNAPARSL